jgi:hypothetical protein
MPRGPTLKERLDKTTLEKLYNQSGLSTIQIATRYGSTSPQILKLMKEYEYRAVRAALARPSKNGPAGGIHRTAGRRDPQL